MKQRYGWLVAGLVGLAVFSWLHSVPTFPDPDAYYHGVMAQAAWNNELPTALPQAWFTELRDQFFDQHLLYHYILAPFVALLGIPLGLKFASAFLGGVALAALYAAARALGVRYAWVPVALALATPAWLYRLGLVKVTPLAIAVVLFGIVLAARRRPLAIAMLAMVFAYIYIGFAMLPLIVTVMLGVDWVVEKTENRKQKTDSFLQPKTHNLKPTRLVVVMAAWVGAGLGFVINPYFPQNIGQFITEVFAIGVANQGGIGVESEWLPASAGWLIRYAAVPAIALAAGIVGAVLNPRRRLAAGLVAVGLCAFAAAVKTRRYIEYATPLVLLAFAVAVPLESVTAALREWWQRSWGRVAILAACLAFVAGLFISVQMTRQGLNKLFPASGLGGACTWLQQNLAPGTMVYNVNWGEWPLLFSCRSDLRYTTGLDMRFIYRPYPLLAERHQRIAQGKLGGSELTRTIVEDFGAQYAIVTENNTTTAESLAAAPGAREVYKDSRVAIYEIR